jgi:hypothetical protein
MGHLHRRDARGNLAQGRLDKLEPDQSIAFCEELFADMLDGAA